MDESNNVINRKSKYLTLKQKILKINFMIKLYHWKKKLIKNNWNKYVPVLYCHDCSHKYVIKLTEFCHTDCLEIFDTYLHVMLLCHKMLHATIYGKL